eukprot:CAMPEP_0167771714 /NCGR_PEP_ID=MMETSP0111_2-20121227/435_1 /TAXON_ID=91324 /ORGANISM="Lotharella globosa, Strain CCCM811" /LENGTH=711 /DNA_ID=CAMNT_0007661105 /DNA_START=130 /DNA_END=2262 /DNA_ORIENTATION=+
MTALSPLKAKKDASRGDSKVSGKKRKRRRSSISNTAKSKRTKTESPRKEKKDVFRSDAKLPEKSQKRRRSSISNNKKIKIATTASPPKETNDASRSDTKVSVKSKKRRRSSSSNAKNRPRKRIQRRTRSEPTEISHKRIDAYEMIYKSRKNRAVNRLLRKYVPSALQLLENGLLERDWGMVSASILSLDRCNEQVPADIIGAMLETQRRFRPEAVTDVLTCWGEINYQHKRRGTIELAIDGLEAGEYLRAVNHLSQKGADSIFLKFVPEVFCLRGAAYYHLAHKQLSSVPQVPEVPTDTDKDESVVNRLGKMRKSVKRYLAGAVTSFAKAYDIEMQLRSKMGYASGTLEARLGMAFADETHGSSAGQDSQDIRKRKEKKTRLNKDSGLPLNLSEEANQGSVGVVQGSVPMGVIAHYLHLLCHSEDLPVPKKSKSIARSKLGSICAGVFAAAIQEPIRSPQIPPSASPSLFSASETRPPHFIPPFDQELSSSSEAYHASKPVSPDVLKVFPALQQQNPHLLRVLLLEAIAAYGRRIKADQGDHSSESDDDSEDEDEAEDDNDREKVSEELENKIPGKREAGMLLIKADPMSEDALETLVRHQDGFSEVETRDAILLLTEQLDVCPGDGNLWQKLRVLLNNYWEQRAKHSRVVNVADIDVRRDFLKATSERLSWWTRSPFHFHPSAIAAEKPMHATLGVRATLKSECLMLMRK